MTPAASTGLTGTWHLGPDGALRTDFGLVPRALVVSDEEKAWSTLRDLLTRPTPEPAGLEAPRRWRAARGVHGAPAAHAGATVLCDADKVYYSAPRWVARLVGVLREPRLGVLVTEDTGHHADALVIREAGEIVAVAVLRRLNAQGMR